MTFPTWTSPPAEAKLTIVDSLQDLRDMIPPQFYDVVAEAAEQQAVADLDICEIRSLPATHEAFQLVLGQAHTETCVTQSRWVDTCFPSHERRPKRLRSRHP